MAEQNYEKENIFNLKQKYKAPVLLEIYESGKILHSVLANRISVSPSGLNAIIKKLNEADPQPIHIDKQSKFTFYSLEQIGIDYVKNKILPEIAENDGDKEKIHIIIKLLNVLKDRNSKEWMNVLEKIITEEDLEEFEEGYGFLKELGNYYVHSSEEAEFLLSLTVTDRDLQKKILDYFKNNDRKSFESVWEVLNYWEEEDCFEVYHFIDILFATLVGEEIMPDKSFFNFTYGERYIEAILDKIHVILLQALLKNYSKEDMVKAFLNEGLEKHLSLYLAEKYINCKINYEQKI